MYDNVITKLVIIKIMIIRKEKKWLKAEIKIEWSFKCLELDY